jgi:hypothetical protein
MKIKVKDLITISLVIIGIFNLSLTTNTTWCFSVYPGIGDHDDKFRFKWAVPALGFTLLAL